MIAFHGRQQVKDEYLGRVRAHRAADELVHGQYWDKDEDGVFRGCAVGCTLHSGRHQDYETELGVPRILARLEDGIFEGLGEDRAMEWPEQFLAAIPVGADLSMVWPRFAVWLLVDEDWGVLRYARTDRSKVAIREVADMYSRILAGEIVSSDERQKIHKYAAAAYAADAAYAAAYADAAAYAAAYAADAAYADAAAYAYAAAYAAAYAYADARTKVRAAQADKLLELMAAAPVLEGETVSA